MYESMQKTAHDGGFQIAAARAPYQYRAALANLRTVTDPDMLAIVAEEHKSIEGLLTEKPFNIGMTREHAIGLGVLPIIHARDMPESEAIDVIPDLLVAYLSGIRGGGGSRSEARVEVSSVIAGHIHSSLEKSSHDAFNNAKGLYALSRAAGVLVLRDRMDVRIDFILHRRRHRTAATGGRDVLRSLVRPEDLP